MFVCLIIYLSPLASYIYISGSGQYISLKSSGDIPMMFAHQLQVIINFWYVYQSFCWLTTLLKLGL